MVGYATNSQGLRPALLDLNDRLTGFEDRISGLKIVI
jgi:hypothetical protein